jgi:two-component system, NtrC family, nitrogen regulation sensor histidine kinase NtrY
LLFRNKTRFPRDLSLKTKTFVLLACIVLLATVPPSVYYVKTIGALAHLGASERIDRTLSSSIDAQTSDAGRRDAALALKEYRQISVLRESIMRQVVLFSVFYVVFVAVLSLAVGYLFIARITKGLGTLTRATDLLAADDPLYKIESSEGGEIGRLIDAFNTMGERLTLARQEKIMAERRATWQRVARIIAHEIKNPLTPIKLSTERLYEKFLNGAPDFPDVLKSTTRTILSEIDNLQKLVETFHKYAKFPDPVLKLEPIGNVVRETCGMFGAEAGVTLDLAPDLPVVNIDKGQIREALTNLLKNAVQAVEEAGQPGEIRVSGKVSGDYVEIAIADNGCGISAENQKKLFQPYFTTKKHGTGIGLALTERIINLHGGKILCESAEGAGTTFTLLLNRKDPYHGQDTRC